MIVTSSWSNINTIHLEKATVSTGKEGLLSEGNAAYNWSSCTEKKTHCLQFGNRGFLELNSQGGKKGILATIMADVLMNWKSQLSKRGSLKKLYFYHQHLTAIADLDLI
ncbi:hypothetical protein ACB092_05G134300 [Castanea dentata]